MFHNLTHRHLHMEGPAGTFQLCVTRLTGRLAQVSYAPYEGSEFHVVPPEPGLLERIAQSGSPLAGMAILRSHSIDTSGAGRQV